MSAKLTETEHIRNIINVLNEDPNMPGPGDIGWPSGGEDPAEEPSYADNSAVEELIEPIHNMQRQIASMQKTFETDPKAAYASYKENLDAMLEAFPADADAGSSQSAYEKEYNNITREYEHLDDPKVKNKKQLRNLLKDAEECFLKLEDLVANYAEEIGSAAESNSDMFK